MLKNRKFQRHLASIFFDFLALGSYGRSNSSILPEYGEVINDIINQATQNCVAGEVPVGLSIYIIEKKVPLISTNQ